MGQTRKLLEMHFVAYEPCRRGTGEGKGKAIGELGKSIEFVRQISAQMEIDRKARKR